MSAFNKGSHSGKGDKSASRRQGKNTDHKDENKAKGSILNADLSSLGKSKKTGKLTPPDQWSLSVDLLPKSVAAINKDRAIAKVMGFVTVGVLLLCIIAGLVANMFVVAARGDTDDARLQQTSLTARKAQFKDIQDVLVTSYDINVARVAALYGEVNWLTVSDQLNASLPEGAKYTSLQLSEYQLGGGSTSAASDSNVWGGNGVIQVSFTVSSPNFISAQQFINNFSGVNGFVTGDLSSVSGGQDSGYTYTGTLALKLDGNTTERSDNSGGTSKTLRAMVTTLRDQLSAAAEGTGTADSSSTSSGSSSSSN
ncbi:hypothetical protein [Bifidobacterium thermophilum]|uniref:hypothetical protein n=1 Tax=Bifidobacterium thermophilum TaxID=33905 RepID=UPI00296E6E80|nr:hypothetical protein [Bifidobacterium thermophilum]